MKPDCQQVLTQFASFSVEELSDSEAASFLEHVEECAPCKGQWLLFEKSLTVVTQSGPRDEDVEQFRSQQMWLVCMEHARHNAQKLAPHANELLEASPVANEHSKTDLNSHVSHIASKNAKEVSGIVAPRVGMTLVGGALLFLASSYWFAPTPATATSHSLPPMPAQIQTTGFKTVPRAAAPLVDYGVTLGFGAMSDRVAPALITAPTKNLTAIKTFESPKN